MIQGELKSFLDLTLLTGNDGNHFNDSLNAPPNNAVGQTIADAIHYASDHIPIFANFSFNNQTPLTFPLTVSVEDGWNMVSIPGLHPVDQDVNTWWTGLVGDVFKFSGGYVSVTTAVPGEGYWMKNLGAFVYNYPAIEIVPHDSIPIHPGWNLIGVYECPAEASGLTTTPIGLIAGTIFGYQWGYFVADTLYPGYGYWLKSSGEGWLNIPPCSD